MPIGKIGLIIAYDNGCVKAVSGTDAVSNMMGLLRAVSSAVVSKCNRLGGLSGGSVDITESRGVALQ